MNAKYTIERKGRLRRASSNMMDTIGDRDSDLQMAATYGKMLLEKNVQLQQELQDLQKVAEETTLENQCLAKQLAAYKDTVSQYSIQCGELEDRVNELQLKNSNLEKKNGQLGLGLSNKNGEIKLLQIELDDARISSGHLEEENELLRRKSEEYSELLVTRANITKDEEIFELKSKNKSLNSKIQSVSKQKMKLEEEITTLMDTNRTLEQSLAEMEGKLLKFQSKLDSLENEKQLSKDSGGIDATDFHPASGTPVGTPKNGVSLFGELDEQFLQLQKQFKDLVVSCNCSASLPYRDKYHNHKRIETTENHFNTFSIRYMQH